MTATPLTPLTPPTPRADEPRRRPTMKEVAALAGVGTKTVSRVVNGEPLVSESTSQRVWAAVRELDYHVDLRAGSLRRPGGATHTIALLVSSVANPFAGEVHRGVEDVARERDVAVIASSLDEDPEREARAVRDSMRRHVDGIIVDTVSSGGSALGSILDLGVPVVFVDRVPRGVEADCVTSDTREAAARATRHMLAHGHRRLALLTEPLTVPTAAERRRGFLDALGEGGLSRDDVVSATGLTGAAAAEEALSLMLRSADPPTAVFSAQNLVTEGALHALWRAGVQHAVAHVGFDDIPLADLLDPALTGVRQDPRRMGRLAAERLFRRLQGPLAPERLVVPTELIVRGSGEIRWPAREPARSGSRPTARASTGPDPTRSEP